MKNNNDIYTNYIVSYIDVLGQKALLENIIDRGIRLLENRLGYVDDWILDVTERLVREESDLPTILVTKDGNVAVRAWNRGIPCEDYKSDQARLNMKSFINQQVEFGVSRVVIDQLFQAGGNFDLNDIGGISEKDRELMRDAFYLCLQSEEGSSILVRNQGGILRPIRYTGKYAIEGIKARSIRQRFLFDACLDPEIESLAALGKAGTGKTLLALAAGIRQSSGREGGYHQVIVIRPTQETGKELGYLPGDVESKIQPHFEPIMAALRRISGLEMITYGDLPSFLKFLPPNYMRGYTVSDAYIVIDEAQNLRPKDIKSLVSRAGENTKMVLTGDPFQIDDPYMDARSNGLSVYVDRFKGNDPQFVCVTLTKGERSRLATRAADLL